MNVPAAHGSTVLVLDTNIVLDLLVFSDAATGPLADALAGPAVTWVTTPVLRLELLRVLAYPKIVSRLLAHGQDPDAVLARYDHLSRMRAAGAPCPVRCTDRDDQVFIDLAVAHGALLLSRDRQVLRLRKRLAALGVTVRSVMAPAT